ncbi:MAG: PAC2 family protein [Actinobacteria bacterium]|nr:PAC2 family protein [Actinomycetota bacterium]
MTGTSHQAPVMIAAFEGWNDAGSAATAVIDLLLEEWEAEEADAVDAQDYYDFQVNRPIVERDEDGVRQVLWPGTILYTAAMPSGREALLVRGIEPSFRWRDFAHELLESARSAGVTEVYLLGALLADVPHTRALPASATSSSERVRRTLALRESDYEGPTGIVGVLDAMAGENGFEPVSIWVSVPHYVAEPPSPKASLTLVRELAGLLDEEVDTAELAEEAASWESGVSELAEENPDVAGYVAQLEKTRDTAESPEATGEALAREFERYLRRRGKS